MAGMVTMRATIEPQWDAQSQVWWFRLHDPSEIPELATASGLSEEYLQERYDSARAVGRNIKALITWKKD